ncbi:hypothetical protein M0R89_09270 [Halorussus limi]|uniref:Uncharacterized protein n=1 Tax=Halorussus limi TaxID=2938695 RepID=A0A8U0HPC9_9EURY|nr:hypothetical protein [Halorussus limi]UPV72738.1 hypothetical protein M0R89_09270 [Halorussus limi]
MSDFLAFVALLWFILAVAVAFHATGHDRSGLLWFVIVFLTGIFGVVFYLLAITSGSPNESTEHIPDSGPTARDFEQRVRNQEALFLVVEEHLRNHGVVTKTGFQNTIYPKHPVGYESESNWWNEFLLPELESREQFERMDGIENGWKLANDD